MGANKKFFVCEKCGNIVGMIHSSGAPLTCCGEVMSELIPNVSDGAKEKHVPVIAIEGYTATVTVGSVEHPMTEEHHIEWIYLETTDGGHRKCLKVGEKPTTCFCLCNEEVVAVYAYCNLHGLWMASVS